MPGSLCRPRPIIVMDNKPKRIEYLVNRYLRGNLTSQELHEMNMLLQTALYDEIFKNEFDRQLADETLTLEEAGLALEAPAMTYTDQPATPKRKRPPVRLRRVWTAVGIAATLLCCMIVGWNRWAPNQALSSQAMTPRSVVDTMFIQPGQLRLPDGTRVLVNRHTRILYDKAFDDTVRQVTLYGEAFFDVVRDTLRPFHVRTYDITTQVLGTSFNVKATHKNPLVEVTVASGHVKVADEHQTYADLWAHENVAINRAARRTIETNQEDYGKALQWEQKFLILDGMRTDELLRTMQLRYHVQFTLENPALKHQPLQGAIYDDNADFDTMIKLVCTLLNVTYRKQEHMVYLEKVGGAY